MNHSNKIADAVCVVIFVLFMYWVLKDYTLSTALLKVLGMIIVLWIYNKLFDLE